jgi:hypothetical protein
MDMSSSLLLNIDPGLPMDCDPSITLIHYVENRMRGAGRAPNRSSLRTWPRAGAHGPYAPDRRFSAHAVAERHVHPADAVAMDWLDGSLPELPGLIPNSEFETGDSELQKPAAIGSLCSPSGKSSTVAVQGKCTAGRGPPNRSEISR